MLKSQEEKTTKKTPRSPLEAYKIRPHIYENESLHEYFYRMMQTKASKNKKEIIPHYVGASIRAVYPPTIKYARAMLMIHKPWRGSEVGSTSDFVREFNAFMESHKRPQSLLISYNRARNKYHDTIVDHEKIAEKPIIRNDEIPEEDVGIEILTAKHQSSKEQNTDFEWPLCENYDWSVPIIKVRYTTLKYILCIFSPYYHTPESKYYWSRRNMVV